LILSISLPWTATAQIHNEADASFVRIQANNAGDAAIIEIGQGALMNLRGKTVTLNVTARSADRATTQLSLTCDFFGTGELTGRHRFEVSPTLEPLLFQLRIPQSINSPAKLYITSDLSDSKSAVDIFTVLIHTES